MNVWLLEEDSGEYSQHFTIIMGAYSSPEAGMKAFADAAALELIKYPTQSRMRNATPWQFDEEELVWRCSGSEWGGSTQWRLYQLVVDEPIS